MRVRAAGNTNGVTAGLDLGVKLCWSSIGSLHFGLGWSRGSPVHGYVAVGVNSLALLIPLALIAH